jgi:hypothetical protein
VNYCPLKNFFFKLSEELITKKFTKKLSDELKRAPRGHSRK